jgi:hypothetical protein
MTAKLGHHVSAIGQASIISASDFSETEEVS